MNTLITITIIIAIYLISAFLWWIYIHIAHSKNGRWSNSLPNTFDIIITFIPIVNSVAAIIYWLLGNPYNIENRHKTNKSISRFFNIKN